MEPVERALETRLSPYKYKQLPTVRSCRLIRLKRKLHRRTKAVVVELVEADIDHPPIYNALSYAWDSPQPNSFVICSGCAIPVTINCQEALKKLRKCDSGQLLFVDAICINQSSTEEKNHQVAAMGDIYTNAQKVICWIGNISHSLVEWESRLNHFIFRKIDSLGRWMNPLSHFFWAHSYKEFLLDITDAIKASSWVERVWTVQEFALGNEIYLQCGSHRFSHKELYHLLEHGTPGVVSTIPEIKDLLQIHELARRVTQEGRSARAFNGDQRDENVTAMNPSIVMSTVIGNRSKLSSQPKDKIFSLFSIFQLASVSISEPDYERSLEDITYEATSALVRGGCGLQFLESTCTPEPWPSWVPDLSKHMYKRQGPGSFKIFDREKSDHQIQGREVRTRRATRVEHVVSVSMACIHYELVPLTKALQLLYEPNTGIMRAGIKTSPMLENLILCQLVYLNHLRSFLIDVAEIWNDSQFRDLPKDDRFPPEKRPPNARVVSDVLLRHLAYSIKRGHFLDDVVESIPHFLWAIMDGVFIPIDDKVPDHHKPSWRTEVLEEPLGAESDWDTLVFLDNCSPYLMFSPYDHFREAFMGSRAFVTSSGLCGFATAEVQEGDLVVRIIGMSTLVIIRPSGDNTFRLISSADLDYDILLPEIEAMWKEGSEWITIS